LDPQHGEIKPLCTAKHCRGKGIGLALLQYLLREAQARNYQHLSLETGSIPFFESSWWLYAKFGFGLVRPR